MVDLGRRVRRIRREQELSQSALATAAGMALNSVNRIEKGHMNPSAESVARIAAALGVPVGALYEELETTTTGKVSAPPETGPASLTREQAAASLQRLQSPPEIELDQLHDHGIPASHADVRTLNMYLEGFWRAQRTGQPFAVASLAKDNVDYEHIALLATYVLTTTKEPRFLTPEQVEAVHQGIHDQLVGARG
jgi:transcriptional regulator with XRE-family HTH domain